MASKEQLRKETERLLKENQRLLVENESMRAANARLQAQLTTMQTGAEVAVGGTLVQQLQAQAGQLEEYRRRTDLYATTTQHTLDLRKLQEENEVLRQENKELRAKNDALEKEIFDLRVIIAQHQTTIDELKTTIDELKSAKAKSDMALLGRDFASSVEITALDYIWPGCRSQPYGLRSLKNLSKFLDCLAKQKKAHKGCGLNGAEAAFKALPDNEQHDIAHRYRLVDDVAPNLLFFVDRFKTSGDGEAHLPLDGACDTLLAYYEDDASMLGDLRGLKEAAIELLKLGRPAPD